MMKLFEKKPGERMPNLLGWVVILTNDVIVVLFILAVFVTCHGCGASTSTYDTPAGQVEMTDRYYAGLWSSHSETIVSAPRYRECLAERQALLPVYHNGRVLNWEEMSPIQRDCFSQTTPSAAMGTSTSGGEGGFGGAYGYAWDSSPQLSITPGIRKGENK